MCRLSNYKSNDTRTFDGALIMSIVIMVSVVGLMKTSASSREAVPSYSTSYAHSPSNDLKVRIHRQRYDSDCFGKDWRYSTLFPELIQNEISNDNLKGSVGVHMFLDALVFYSEPAPKHV